MAFAIDFLPTISSCQAVSQINRAIARWGPHAGYDQMGSEAPVCCILISFAYLSKDVSSWAKKRASSNRPQALGKNCLTEESISVRCSSP
jgi:hypothetical protein